MDLMGMNLGPFMWVAVIAGLLQLCMLVLLILVLLDTRRFIAEAVPLMRQANRWLARRDSAE